MPEKRGGGPEELFFCPRSSRQSSHCLSGPAADSADHLTFHLRPREISVVKTHKDPRLFGLSGQGVLEAESFLVCRRPQLRLRSLNRGQGPSGFWLQVSSKADFGIELHVKASSALHRTGHR